MSYLHFGLLFEIGFRSIQGVYEPLQFISLLYNNHIIFADVRVDTSARDFLRKSKRTVSKTIVTTSSDTVVTSSAYDSCDALASVPSHSGKRLGVLRETFNGTIKKRYVEVWRGSKLEAIKDVTKTHEDFLLHRKCNFAQIVSTKPL